MRENILIVLGNLTKDIASNIMPEKSNSLDSHKTSFDGLAWGDDI